MIQLYLLSIVLNGLAGFLLVSGDAIEGGSTASGGSRFSLSSGGLRLVLGILTAITGILKLLLPVHPEGSKPIYVLGDLLPALAGIGAGFILIFGFYRKSPAGSDSTDTEGKIDRIGDTLLQNKKIAGITLLAISVLHFIFANALFL
jgi:hypothetical protein